MKTYILSKNTDESDYELSITCASTNINDIRNSICKDFTPNEDYPILEIWENGTYIDTFQGGKVLKKIAEEINLQTNNCYSMYAKRFETKLNELGITFDDFTSLTKAYKDLPESSRCEVHNLLTKKE